MTFTDRRYQELRAAEAAQDRFDSLVARANETLGVDITPKRSGQTVSMTLDEFEQLVDAAEVF